MIIYVFACAYAHVVALNCFRLSQERPEFTFQQTECKILGTPAELASHTVEMALDLVLNRIGTCRQAPCLILSCALESKQCKKKQKRFRLFAYVHIMLFLDIYVYIYIYIHICMHLYVFI